MKNLMKIAGGLLVLVGIIAAINLLHAQEAVQGGVVSLTDTNVDWNAMSDLEVELKAVESVPPMPANSLPSAGTYWSAQHAPGTAEEWPPLPTPLGMGAWSLGDDGVYLLDDLNHAYASPKQSTSAATTSSGMMTTADVDINPADGGDDTNDDSGGGYSPQLSPVEEFGTNLWLEITNLTNNTADFMVSNTIADVEYEIQSRADLVQGNWNSEGFFFGSEITNWTPTSAIATNYPNLFYRIRSWIDSDGNGLPDWWQLKYFGHTGVDPYADPDGDGWNNLQEFQNGTDPTVFNTPPAPQGLTASLHQTSSTATVNWLPDSGNVTSYTVEKTDAGTYPETVQDFTVSADDYLDNISGDSPNPWDGNNYDVSYRIKANYTGGSSAWSASAPLQQPTVSASTLPGINGATYLAVSGVPANASTIRLVFIEENALLNGDTSFDYTENIPVSSLTNGLFQLPDAWQPPVTNAYGYTEYADYVESVDSSGDAGAANPFYYENWSLSYFDGRAQLKQNLKFLLRAATVDNSFGYYTGIPLSQFQPRTFPTNYAEASFYQNFSFGGDYYAVDNPPFLNVLQPFQDNYLYKNCSFDASRLQQGCLNTGLIIPNYPLNGFGFDYLIFSNTPAYTFTPPLTNGTPIAALGPDQAQWLATGQHFWNRLDLSEIGVNYNYNSTSPTNTMLSGVRNIFGLQFLSTKIAWANGSGSSTFTLNPGYSTTAGGYYYTETSQPQLQTVEYDFWNPNDGIYYYSWSTPEPLPEGIGFSPTNASNNRLMVAVGNSITVAGYAKMAVQNGYSGVYGYLGQYFDKAYQITNGVVTTNTTGVLSPYGNFFATQGGPAALVTMPDIDTGARGTCTVYCVSMNVDANHDGNMDLSFKGPDATSQASPMEFWVNSGWDDPNGVDLPNYGFTNSADGQINGQRDLENFARLWMSGLPALPSAQGYSVTLSWQNISGSPAVNLFRSVETNGGIGYLTDTNVAAAQTVFTYPGGSGLVFGQVPGNGSFTFPADFFDGTNKHFLFEGAGIGSGELTMTIVQNGNTIAQTGVWLDLHDIKDFYERTVITDNTSGAISNWNSSIEAVQQATSSALGNDTNLIVFVHGFNVKNWDWLDDGDTVFKRLYWADYQGKFASVSWPDITISWSAFFSDGLYAFNWSELNAYKASGAMKSYLTQLHSRFPNYRLNILAHSQGNAVVSEAIEQGAPFDTYILTQAALPANSYDVNTTNDADLLVDEYAYPTPEWRPLGYRGAYTNLTGNIVNFFNPLDPALADWLTGQKYLKPNPDYSYDGTNCWFNKGESGAYILTDMQESHAFVSRSRSQPIGRQGLSPGEVKEGIMSSIVDLNAQFGFNGSTIGEHSAQWTRPIQTCLPYYTEILTEIKPAP